LNGGNVILEAGLQDMLSQTGERCKTEEDEVVDLGIGRINIDKVRSCLGSKRG
jgi:hypothetical protein